MLFGATILLAVVALSAAGSIGGHTSDQSLMKLIMKTKFSDDPETVAHCFDYFLPILNNEAEEFSRSFQQCATSEKERIKRLNENATKDRNMIESATDGVCARLDTCKSYDNTLDFFDCYSVQGNQNTQIIYTITQNSTEKSAELREQYVIIQVDKYKCQNASERAYVESTAITYKELDTCLQTGYIPSTVSPVTTSTTEITTTTKKEDESTTQVSSTTPATLTTPATPTTSTTLTTPTTPTTPTSTTEEEPEDTTTVQPQEDLSGIRGLKILSELQRYWRNK